MTSPAFHTAHTKAQELFLDIIKPCCNDKHSQGLRKEEHSLTPKRYMILKTYYVPFFS